MTCLTKCRLQRCTMMMFQNEHFLGQDRFDIFNSPLWHSGLTLRKELWEPDTTKSLRWWARWSVVR
jgi:hypothetical protein